MKRFYYCFCLLFLLREGVAIECPALFVEDRIPVLNLTFSTPVDAPALDKASRSLKKKLRTELQRAASNQNIKLRKSPSEVEMNAIDFAVWIADEAFSNATKWGNKYDPMKNIQVEVSVTSDKIVVSVRDQGEKPFDPANDPYSLPADADEAVQTVVDERRRQRSGGKLDGYGMFWGDAIHNWEYGYRFESGSHVILAVPWKHVEEY